jgi:hypothetical protein
MKATSMEIAPGCKSARFGWSTFENASLNGGHKYKLYLKNIPSMS